MKAQNNRPLIVLTEDRIPVPFYERWYWYVRENLDEIRCVQATRHRFLLQRVLPLLALATTSVIAVSAVRASKHEPSFDPSLLNSEPLIFEPMKPREIGQ